MKENPPIHGFGMSPISATMQDRYDLACTGVLSLLSGDRIDIEATRVYLSEFKGICNRCWKQDQVDWFTVYTAFGSPKEFRLSAIATEIPLLRRALKENDTRTMGECLANIEKLDARSLIKKNLSPHLERGNSWIYILSKRDLPTLLRIGKTSRTVDERVREINAASGDSNPYSARAAFRVENPVEVEKEVYFRL